MDSEMRLSIRQVQGGASTERFVTLKADANEVLVDAWIAFLDEPDLPEPESLDGALLLVVFRCMERGGRLFVEGPLSKSLVRSIRHFQEAWARWRPDRYRHVEIVADSVAEASHAHDRAIAAFSGGVDSTFLALQHTSGELGAAKYPLTDVMFAHGLDIPSANTEAFAKAVDRHREFLGSVTLRPRLLRTNVRDFYPSNYEDAHGALICGLLHQYSHAFGFGLISSSNAYENLRLTWGSNPVIDPLMGTECFSIVHDGAGYNRIEKVERVAVNEVATKGLRVCWRDTSYTKNCGVCEKCILTQLEFLALGHANPPCFDRPLDTRLIDTVTPASLSRLRGYEWVLETSKAFDAQPWRMALEKRVRKLRNKEAAKNLRASLGRLMGRPG